MTFRIEGNQDSNYPKKMLQQNQKSNEPKVSIFQNQNSSNTVGATPPPVPDPTTPGPTPPPSPTTPDPTIIAGSPVCPPEDPTHTTPGPIPPPSPTTPDPTIIAGSPVCPPEDPTPTTPEPLPPTGINDIGNNATNTTQPQTQKRMLKAGAPLPQGDGIKIYDMSGRLVTGETATRSGMYIIKKE